MLVSIYIHNDQSWLANYLWRILHSTSKGLTLQAAVCTVRNFRGYIHFLRKYVLLRDTKFLIFGGEWALLIYILCGNIM